MLTMNSVQGGIISLIQTTEGQNIRNQQPKQSWKTYKIIILQLATWNVIPWQSPVYNEPFQKIPPAWLQ